MGRNCMPSKMKFNSLGDNSFQFYETLICQNLTIYHRLYSSQVYVVYDTNHEDWFSHSMAHQNQLPHHVSHAMRKSVFGFPTRSTTIWVKQLKKIVISDFQITNIAMSM